MFNKNQIITALAVSYLAAIAAAQFTWPTTLVELFQSPDTPLNRPMTTTEGALFGSLSSVGSMVGLPLFAFLFDKIGRKQTVIFSGLPLLVTWTVLAVTNNTYVVLFALFISGLSLGGFFVTIVYVGEIAATDVRGTLCSFPIVGFSVGVLLSYAIGGYLPYWVAIYTHLTLSVVYVICAQLPRESPVFLLMKNDEKGALAALSFYRSLPDNHKLILDELNELKNTFSAGPGNISLSADDAEASSYERETLKTEKSTENKPQTAFKILCKSTSAKKALVLCLVLVTASNFMGMMAVMVYAESLFKRAAPNLPPTACSMLLAVSLLLSSIASALVTDRLGRKLLMMISSLLSGVCMLTLATQLHLDWGPSWVSVTVILLFTFVYNAGAGVVPYVFVGEVFIPEVRALCTAISLNVAWFLNFVLLFVFPLMVRWLSLHGVYYIFTAVCFFAVFYTMKAMPETKGLTPREIQLFFTDSCQDRKTRKRVSLK